MRTQIIQDYNGLPTGVFIPIEDWTLIKNNYPDIETLEQELPQWEKDLIDSRLDDIAKNPERLHPIESLFAELKRKI
jgi:hypothetical protein